MSCHVMSCEKEAATTQQRGDRCGFAKVPQQHLHDSTSYMLKAGALHLLILFAGPAAAVHHPGEVRLDPGGSLEAIARAT